MLNPSDSYYQKTKQAIDSGDLEQSLQSILQHKQQNNLKVRELAKLVATKLASRSERYLDLNNEEGAWVDLLNAELLRTKLPFVEKIREKLTSLMMVRAQNCLGAGNLSQCEEILGKLRDRNCTATELPMLITTCVTWIEGREFAEKGEFQPAMAALDRVKRRLIYYDKGVLDELLLLHAKKLDFDRILPSFYSAVSIKDKARILELGAMLLAIAPRHYEINRIRKAAFKELEVNSKLIPLDTPSSHPGFKIPVSPHNSSYFIWIDNIAGYLVLLDDKVTIGHAGVDNSVGLPWVADIASIHASLVRQDEGFLIEPHQAVSLDGKAITSTEILNNDSILQLGDTCKIKFRLPFRGSLTAILEPISHHRPPVPVDGVILMSQTLIFGNNEGCHIKIPTLNKSIRIYRTSEGLKLKAEGVTRVNGNIISDSVLLEKFTIVVFENITFSIETAPIRLGL